MRNRLLLITAAISTIIFMHTGFDKVDTGTEKEWKNTEETNGKLISERKKKMKGKIPQDQPDKFAELHKRLRTAPGDSLPSYPQNYKFKEFRKAMRNMSLSKSATQAYFTERGPGNVGGRTRSIVVDVSDPTNETWFAAAVTGGIWKTTDAGEHWVEKTKGLPNISTSCLVQSRSNPDVFYAGTGEAYIILGRVCSDGIFKSTDHGESWHQLESSAATSEVQAISRLIIDPEDEDRLLFSAVGRDEDGRRVSSILKTIDGGNTWKIVYRSEVYRNVDQIIANPNSFDTLYAALNSKGILKSTDAGDTWKMSSIGINDGRIELAVSRNNPDILYASTERSYLYRTTDAGKSWCPVQLNGESRGGWTRSQGWYDNAVQVHPFNDNIVYLGGVDIYKSEINGSEYSGKKITAVNENGTESFMTGSYAYSNGIWYGGISVTEQGTYGLKSEDFNSVEIRFGAGKSQKAHRLLYDYGNRTYFFSGDMASVPFEVWDVDNNRQLEVSICDDDNDGSLTINNDYYGYESFLVYALEHNGEINPLIQNDITYKRYLRIFPKLISGAEWNNFPESSLQIIFDDTYTDIAELEQVSVWVRDDDYTGLSFVHADQHSFTMIDNNDGSFRFLVGNDGGVFYSDDEGISWTEANNGYNTSQFYGADKNPVAEEFFGGMQDNGSWQSPPNTNSNASTLYRERIGGDGFSSIWKYDDPEQMIGTIQQGKIFKSTNSGKDWTYIGDDIFGASDFVTYIAKSNSDPELLLTPRYNSIWRSDDFGDTWTASDMDPDLSWGGEGPIEISKADPQIVWVGDYLSYKYAGRKSTTQVSTDGGITFNGTSHPGDYGSVSGLASSPTDPNTAFVLLSVSGQPKILRTTDLGNSWEDISGFGENNISSNGFPDVAVYDLVVMPFNTDMYWACTEIGIFESYDAGRSWSYLNNRDFRAVCVWHAEISGDMIVLATHGRGIWTAEFAELEGYEPPAVTLAPLLSISQVSNSAEINLDLRSGYDSTFVFINDSLYESFESTSEMDTTLIYETIKDHTINVNLVSYKNGHEYKAAPKEFELKRYYDIVDEFKTDFSSDDGTFYLEGLEIKEEPGLGYALSTSHPLSEWKAIAELLVPVKVRSGNATLKYKDIALVTPHDSSITDYTDYDFKDYVIVEGTKDGINWLPLCDGYDAAYNELWLNTYYNGKNVIPAHLVSHEINLLNTFNAGDIIRVRFRYQDASGYDSPEIWGWLIDDLEIQGEVVAIEGDEIIPSDYALYQNYPNPFNPTTTIEYSIPVETQYIASPQHVTLKVYDILGREVATLVNEKQKPGRHKVEFNASALSSGVLPASGVYFYRMDAGKYSDTKKLILLK